MQRRRGALILIVLAAAACERSDSAAIEAERPAREVHRVVARVGDEVIGASDVAERMRVGGLDPRAALDELIDEVVLVNEARTRGVRASAEERRAIERVMVRRMLADFEAELTPQRVPDEEVRADFETYRDKFQVPERRESWHILVRDSSDAGRRLAETILGKLRGARDPRVLYEHYAGGRDEHELEVIAEELPAISRSAGFEKAYKDALFDAESRGVLDRPVETKYGWHVIVLTDVVPGRTRELSDVEEGIRERLSQKMRFERVVQTVDALRAQGLVEYDDEGVDRLLSMSELPKRSE